MKDKIGILIPAHNEEKNIGALVSELKKEYSNVIVVDDGSTDNTNIYAKESGALVLSHPVCKGKGEALKTGFRYILEKGIPAVITLDGDGQHPIEDIPGFLRAYKRNQRASIWVGKRKIKGTKMPLIRRLTNISMSVLISGVACQWIPDTQSGFRLIKKEVLSSIKLNTSHFETESEILIKASWKGFGISSVLISTIYDDEKSKIRPLTDTKRFFIMLASILFPPIRKIKK
jgi:glycosyltransferase involved in cell wall biosynthesis